MLKTLTLDLRRDASTETTASEALEDPGISPIITSVQNWVFVTGFSLTYHSKETTVLTIDPY